MSLNSPLAVQKKKKKNHNRKIDYAKHLLMGYEKRITFY